MSELKGQRSSTLLFADQLLISSTFSLTSTKGLFLNISLSLLPLLFLVQPKSLAQGGGDRRVVWSQSSSSHTKVHNVRGYLGGFERMASAYFAYLTVESTERSVRRGVGLTHGPDSV